MDEGEQEKFAADPAEEAKEEALAFLTVFTGLIAIVVGFLLVHCLRVKKVSWIPEAWVFFTLGLTLGVWIHSGISSTRWQLIYEELRGSFHQLFFVVLLPPIIFESGYNMDKKSFFSNFDGIFTYAVLGTLIATFSTGILLWFIGWSGITFGFSMLDAITFGAIISAVDPVTVLAVFQSFGVNETLYSFVFGESVLNDAVAIVLYHTMLNFHAKHSIQAQDIVMGCVYFTVTFVGSLFIGFISGLASALMCKLTRLGRVNPEIERGLLTLWPFLAYMLAEGLQLSGVVSILFAGITMAHYTVHNLSPATRKYSSHLFKVLSSIAEGLVFMYIGLACPAVFNHRLVSKYWSLLPITVLERGTRIDGPMRFILWFGGLRGGVSFALSSSARIALGATEASELMEICTLLMVVVTLLCCGGTVGPLVRHLGLASDSPLSTVEAQGPMSRFSYDYNLDEPTARFGIYEDGWLPGRYYDSAGVISRRCVSQVHQSPIGNNVRKLVRKNLTKHFYVQYRWPHLQNRRTMTEISEYVQTALHACYRVWSGSVRLLSGKMYSCWSTLKHFVGSVRGTHRGDQWRSRYSKLDVIVEEVGEENDEESVNTSTTQDSDEICHENQVINRAEPGGALSPSVSMERRIQSSNHPDMSAWENFDETVLKRFLVSREDANAISVDTDTAYHTGVAEAIVDTRERIDESLSESG